MIKSERIEIKLKIAKLKKRYATRIKAGTLPPLAQKRLNKYERDLSNLEKKEALKNMRLHCQSCENDRAFNFTRFDADLNINHFECFKCSKPATLSEWDYIEMQLGCYRRDFDYYAPALGYMAGKDISDDHRNDIRSAQRALNAIAEWEAKKAALTDNEVRPMVLYCEYCEESTQFNYLAFNEDMETNLYECSGCSIERAELNEFEEIAIRLEGCKKRLKRYRAEFINRSESASTREWLEISEAMTLERREEAKYEAMLTACEEKRWGVME